MFLFRKMGFANIIGGVTKIFKSHKKSPEGSSYCCALKAFSNAGMAKLVNARDLDSLGGVPPSGFDSRCQQFIRRMANRCGHTAARLVPDPRKLWVPVAALRSPLFRKELFLCLGKVPRRKMDIGSTVRTQQLAQVEESGRHRTG